MKFQEGDLVRIKQSRFVGILEEINPNENWVADDETWAYVRDDSYDGRSVDGPDEIELVMTRDKVSERKLSTAAQILTGINFTDTWGGISIDESEMDGPWEILLYGHIEESARFCARLHVDERR